MGWDGPILTDSGGFQVFSLRDTLAGVDDDGVTFRNVYDGSRRPVHARARRRDPAEPRQRHRDVPRPGAAARRRRAPSSKRRSAGRPSGRGASATRSAPRASSASRSSRAGPTASCGGARPRSSSSSTSTATRSAGSRSARTARSMFETTDWLAPQLPADKPRYFMGIGDPEGILEVIEAGVDMFDCVLPTRTARTGSALTWEGRLNLRNARYARDPAPLDDELRLPGLPDVLPRLPPPPREPGRAARPPPALAPQSTLRARADPPRPRGDRAGRLRLLQARRARRGSDTDMGPVIVIVVLARPRLARCSPCPGAAASARTRRCRTTSSVGDEIITAGGMHAVVREAGETRAPDRDRPRRRRHARPPRGRRRRRERADEDARTKRSEPTTASRANLFLLGLAPLASDARPPRGCRTRRRRVARRSRISRAPLAEAGPRPPGRDRGRPPGEAAAGSDRDLGDDGQRGQHHAHPRRQARRVGAADHEAGHEPDRDRAPRRARPDRGGADHRPDGGARALRPDPVAATARRSTRARTPVAARRASSTCSALVQTGQKGHGPSTPTTSSTRARRS